MNKVTARKRRSRLTRAKIRRLAVPRLCVRRSLQHMYAQVISPCGSKVLVSASTLDKDCQIDGHAGNQAAAARVGELLAKRAKQANISKLAFDRSGYKYHGRIKALADAARAGGIEF